MHETKRRGEEERGEDDRVSVIDENQEGPQQRLSQFT
jgi:hypothetical protein